MIYCVYISMELLYIVIYITLLYISYQDLTTFEVQDRYFLLLFMCLMLLKPLLFTDFIFLILFTLILLPFFFSHMLGGADIKLFAFAILYLGTSAFIVCFLIANLSALSICFLAHKKKIPFIPCIVLGIFLVIIFYL